MNNSINTNSKIKFWTVFLPGGDIHLAKDVGEIPINLATKYNYESHIVGCNFKEKESNIPFFSIHKINRHFNSYVLSGIPFFFKMAKKIDILNLYHTNRRVWIHASLYKFLNKKGKIYIKLDSGLETCDRIDNDSQYRFYFLRCLDMADLITIESEAAKNRLIKYDQKNKIKIIPNGFSETGYKEPQKEEKQKYILTVGNLCHDPKASDLLIQAFHKSKCYDYGWKLVLVGMMDENFEKFYNTYLNEYPDLKKHIIYKGFIDNRAEINNLYRNASIFILPSYKENFSLAACEALSNGCFLILSDNVTPYKELTNNKKFGLVFKTGNIDSLTQAIKEASNHYNSITTDHIVQYAKNKFSWSQIIHQIDAAIKDIL